MAVAGRQNIVRDLVELVRTRALRLAAVDTNQISKVWVKNATEAAGSVPAGKTWMIVELDNATMTTLDEKAFGSHPPHVPDPTRQ